MPNNVCRRLCTLRQRVDKIDPCRPFLVRRFRPSRPPCVTREVKIFQLLQLVYVIGSFLLLELHRNQFKIEILFDSDSQWELSNFKPFGCIDIIEN